MATIDMHGKVCLVTGSSSGVGKETAKELARMGATVVMVCRNRAKGEAVQAEMKQMDGNAQVDLLVADLSSLAEVRHVAEEFTQNYRRLDVLINNAGAVNAEYTRTVDGLEMTFATNYLAPFLLTQLLLERLKASAPARIVNVSSAAHATARIDFADLQGAQRYGVMKAYSQSKLAQIFFTYELADRLAGTGVTVNALHPGLVVSNFNNGINGIARTGANWLYSIIGISAEKGAQTSIYLATSPEVEGVSGKYFANSKEKRSSKYSYDMAVRRRLWDVSEELIRQHTPTSPSLLEN